MVWPVHKNVEIPDQYILGLGRDQPRPRVAHLYKGDFDDPGKAMCREGYNRPDGYSIWRGNMGEGGVCALCLSRALKGLPPVELPEQKDLEK